MNMNPYTFLSSGLHTHEATALHTRLSAWHDAMVAHERRLSTGASSDACDDECPHAEARTLWSEAVATFGARAHSLAFLRSRAQETRRRVTGSRPAQMRAAAAERAPRRAKDAPGDTPATSSTAPADSVAAVPEL